MNVGRLGGLSTDDLTLRWHQRRYRRAKARSDLDGQIEALTAQIPLVGSSERRRLRVLLFYACRQAGRKSLATRHLSQASGRGNRSADTIEKAWSSGDHDQALETFRNLCESLTDEFTASIWEDCFLLAHGRAGDPEIAAAARRHWNVTEAEAALPIVSVSGMGWSGSGAVFDFLRDHLDVADIVGESRLIEGKFGFRGLLEEHADPRFVERLFRVGLVGVTQSKRWEDYRHVRNARRFVSSRRPGLYAHACHVLLLALREGASPSELTEVYRGFFARAVLSRCRSGASLALLDNVVHVEHLDLAQRLGGLRCIPVVRDPRDQFVDNEEQNPNFHHDVERFITDYQEKRRLLEELQLQSGSDTTQVPFEVVQFEDFVRDRPTRESLRERLGIGTRRTAESRRRFDASVSAQNVGIHRRSPRVAEIRRIAEALPEYCEDL